MPTEKAWKIRSSPLLDRLEAVEALLAWEGEITLDPDQRKKDIRIQSWITNNGGKVRAYRVRIFLNGSGWEVFARLSDPSKVVDARKQIV